MTRITRTGAGRETLSRKVRENAVVIRTSAGERGERQAYKERNQTGQDRGNKPKKRLSQLLTVVRLVFKGPKIARLVGVWPHPVWGRGKARKERVRRYFESGTATRRLTESSSVSGGSATDGEIECQCRGGEREQRSDVPSSPEVAHCKNKSRGCQDRHSPFVSSRSYDVLVQIAGHSPQTFGDPGSRTLAERKEEKTARQCQE
jgi:hypothetical protein